MKIKLIWAMARNRVIGRDGDLPWRIPSDLAHFKRTTRGHTVAMGRKTWESIPGALPKRRNLVISRDARYRAEGAEVVPSVDAAIAAARDDGAECLFVLGGAQIYAAALPLADELVTTFVDAEVAGDTVFPELDWSRWQVVESEQAQQRDDDEFACRFERYVRAD